VILFKKIKEHLLKGDLRRKMKLWSNKKDWRNDAENSALPLQE